METTSKGSLILTTKMRTNDGHQNHMKEFIMTTTRKNALLGECDNTYENDSGQKCWFQFMKTIQKTEVWCLKNF